jgi:opacity protein-like surface antigen
MTVLESNMRDKTNKLLIIISVIIILSGTGFGQSDRQTNVGTTAASFLEVGVGSRAIGMGGAFVAVASDASTIYWNPGGLSRLPRGEVIFEHIDWLADISFNYIGLAIPLQEYGSIGLFITSVSIPRMKVRTVEYPDGTGEFFNAADLAFGVSYAKNLTDRFSIGMNAKYISERIWHERAHGFAIDIGTLYYTGIGSLVIGAAITNFGTTMKMDGSDLIIYYDEAPLIDGNNDRIMGKLVTDEWPLPLNMQFGLAFDVFNFDKSRLQVALDAFHPINNTESINVGCELSLLKILFVRAGYKALMQQDTEEGLTLGVGLQYKMFGQSFIKFDYAYADFGQLNDVNRFTLGLNF